MDSPADLAPTADHPSLRKLVLLKTGQDVRRCRDCALCNDNLSDPQVAASLDISLDTLVHMLLWNEEDVLTCKTVWSEPVYQSLRHVCVQGLNFQAIISALREEAVRRNIM